jgi:hypothetical protein
MSAAMESQICYLNTSVHQCAMNAVSDLVIDLLMGSHHSLRNCSRRSQLLHAVVALGLL